MTPLSVEMTTRHLFYVCLFSQYFVYSFCHRNGHAHGRVDGFSFLRTFLHLNRGFSLYGELFSSNDENQEPNGDPLFLQLLLINRTTSCPYCTGLQPTSKFNLGSFVDIQSTLAQLMLFTLY